MKRYLVSPQQFDSRAILLGDFEETWSPEVQELHYQNKERLISELKLELGETNFEVKVENFKALGLSPFSIISHHNTLYYQARYAFIHGFYYPALTAACALGERILNHLILDLRRYYPPSIIDKKAHQRSSINDWTKAIALLDEWGVLQHEDVNSEFEKLKVLRHRSLHFNAETASSLREDALAALGCLAKIIEKQFGFLPTKTIAGSQGAFFLRKNEEEDPFIKHYYLQQCPQVSPFYKMKYVAGTWLIFDIEVDMRTGVSDARFLELFNARSPDQLASDEIPWPGNVSVAALLPGGVRLVDYRP